MIQSNAILDVAANVEQARKDYYDTCGNAYAVYQKAVERAKGVFDRVIDMVPDKSPSDSILKKELHLHIDGIIDEVESHYHNS